MRALSPAMTSLSPTVPVAGVAEEQVADVAERLAAAIVVEAAVAVGVEDAVGRRAAAGNVVVAEVAADRVGAAVALDVVVARVRVRSRSGVEVGVVAGDRVDATLAEEDVLVRLAVDRVVAVRPVRLRRDVRRRRGVEQPHDPQDVRLVPGRLAPGAVERQPVELGSVGSEAYRGRGRWSRCRRR